MIALWQSTKLKKRAKSMKQAAGERLNQFIVKAVMFQFQAKIIFGLLIHEFNLWVQAVKPAKRDKKNSMIFGLFRDVRTSKKFPTQIDCWCESQSRKSTSRHTKSDGLALYLRHK